MPVRETGRLITRWKGDGSGSDFGNRIATLDSPTAGSAAITQDGWPEAGQPWPSGSIAIVSPVVDSPVSRLWIDPARPEINVLDVLAVPSAAVAGSADYIALVSMGWGIEIVRVSGVDGSVAYRFATGLRHSLPLLSLAPDVTGDRLADWVMLVPPDPPSKETEFEPSRIRIFDAADGGFVSEIVVPTTKGTLTGSGNPWRDVTGDGVPEFVVASYNGQVHEAAWSNDIVVADLVAGEIIGALRVPRELGAIRGVRVVADLGGGGVPDVVAVLSGVHRMTNPNDWDRGLAAVSGAELQRSCRRPGTVDSPPSR